MLKTPTKSVLIDGDKSIFITKGAVDRFKKDLKNNDIDKLLMNDYFKTGWTYEKIIETDTEIRVKLVDKTVKKEVKSLNDEKRKELKQRLNDIRKNRLSKGNLMMSLRDSVPNEILEPYMAAKTSGMRVPLPDPKEIMAKPEAYVQTIQMAIQSFGHFKGNNNPYVNYIRALAKYFGLQTTYQEPIQNNEFINQLRTQRNDTINKEVDEEMKKIYDSLNVKDNITVDVDDEMKQIYESLGIKH